MQFKLFADECHTASYRFAGNWELLTILLSPGVRTDDIYSSLFAVVLNLAFRYLNCGLVGF
jgi:hypothetical protein